jgi:large subunit ribosomal protein L25
MEKIVALKVEKREKSGTGQARELRRAKRIPAIIYGGKQEPLNVSLNLNELKTAYMKGWFTSRLINLELDGKQIAALPKEVQVDPVSDQPLHVDFMRVVPNEEILVMVKVDTINADKAPGIKRGGVLNIVRRAIEMICDPNKIPEKIVVDLTGLNIGQSVHIKSVNLPEGVRPSLARNFTVLTIAGRSEKEDNIDTAAPVALAEVEVIGEKDDEEGEEAGDDKGKAKADDKKPKADKK